MSHTPLPWTIETGGADTFSLVNREFEGDEWDIGEIYSQGNAEFILKAVSCHDDLLAACKRAVSFMRGDHETNGIVGVDAVLGALNAAISKAGRRE